MVREWLTAQKATFRDGHWTHPNGKYRYKDGEYGGLLWSLTLSQIAADFDKPNEQALLREINPRMRKGMPSAAAIAAHEVSGGNWLAQSAQKGGVLRVLNWSISDHRAGSSGLYPACSVSRGGQKWTNSAEARTLGEYYKFRLFTLTYDNYHRAGYRTAVLIIPPF
jgi:hypothetical protein